MKILNLYAGIGGNRKLWGDEHEITAVENEQYIADVYAALYPNDTVIVTDAHQYLLDHYKEFDFIWSSPPCQSHSRTNLFLISKGKVRYPDMKLYQEILFLQQFVYCKWVVENVVPYYQPLVRPTSVLERHLFWSNFSINARKFISTIPLEHHNIDTMQEEYDIKLPKGTTNKRTLLRNAVLPSIGKYILDEATETAHILNALEQERLF